jgi:hypothetical protein
MNSYFYYSLRIGDGSRPKIYDSIFLIISVFGEEFRQNCFYTVKFGR